MPVPEEKFQKPRGLVIGAPGSGTGKTTLTLGLIAALRLRGLDVASAKVGPDYIDPRFLEAAAGRAVINLDGWAMPPRQLRSRFWDHAAGCDVAMIEGVMGLFDGAVGGGGSTADVAQSLGLPVVLVVDASGQSQSIAAVVHGFKTYRQDVDVMGVIATRVGSLRHAEMISGALADCGVAHLGCVPNDARLHIASRHLGLVQALENETLGELVDLAAEVVGGAVDIDRMLELCRIVPPQPPAVPVCRLGRRIGVARDAAFAFSYPHVLSDWRKGGAELHFFSPLADEVPPRDCDAVFLPGGYPELHAGTLAAAGKTRAALMAMADRGDVIYGECGGFMYLGQALVDAGGKSHQMLGLLRHTSTFADRARTLGYRKLHALAPFPMGGEFFGHEFHYSRILHQGADEPLFEVRDASGRERGVLGGVRGRVMGSYAHIIDGARG